MWDACQKSFGMVFSRKGTEDGKTSKKNAEKKGKLSEWALGTIREAYEKVTKEAAGYGKCSGQVLIS